MASQSAWPIDEMRKKRRELQDLLLLYAEQNVLQIDGRSLKFMGTRLRRMDSMDALNAFEKKLHEHLEDSI